jgi:hypothetical protein
MASKLDLLASRKDGRAGKARRSVRGRNGQIVYLTTQIPDGAWLFWKADSWVADVPARTDSNTPPRLIVTIGQPAEGDYYFGQQAGERSNPVRIELRSTMRAKAGGWISDWFKGFPWHFAAWAAAFTILLFAVFSGNGHTRTTLKAWGFAGACIIFALWLTYIAAGNREKFSAIVKGDDNRTSTGKLQILLWTITIGLALAYVGAYCILVDTAFACAQDPDGNPMGSNCIPLNNWEQYTILLGLPLAAGVIAKGIVTGKVNSSSVQKEQASEAKASQAVTDDSGRADLVDIQYLVFNVIALTYVIGQFVKSGVLPDVPPILLGLTSAAAGTYVLNKSLLENPPRITAVAPSPVTLGGEFTIYGRNLLPGGADYANVSIEGEIWVGSKIDTNENAIKVTPQKPSSVTAGAHELRVITLANAESNRLVVPFVV